MDRLDRHKWLSGKTGRRLRRILTTIAVVALGYALTGVLMYPFSYSLGAMSSMSSADFSITDMYQILADSRHVRTLSPDIVVVDVNNCTRAQIADAIELVSLCDPKVVGVDISFTEHRADDDALLQSVSLSDRMVAIKMLSTKEEDGELKFETRQRSWFEMQTGPNVSYAAANFPSDGVGGTIRYFRPEFPMTDGTVVPSLALALAQVVAPDKAEALLKRGNTLEPVNYPSTEFMTLRPAELYERPEDLTGKIVLIGVLNDPADMHRTPIDPRISGTLIQAYALNTILTESYLTEAPEWIGLLVAFLIASIFVHASMNLNGGWKSIAIRLAQLLVLYSVLYVGYWFFLERSCMINFSRSFLMLAFALFSVDLWNGAVSLGKSFHKWIRSKRGSGEEGEEEELKPAKATA